MFNPSRDEVREFFFNTWTKFKQNLILTDLEKITLGVTHMHPEYHAILSAPDQFKNQEYFPDLGETNPFLHMSLHLSILEQISINQPTGITDIYQQLKQQYKDDHNAQHAILECLAETIWQAQRNNIGFDGAAYLHLLQLKTRI